MTISPVVRGYYTILFLFTQTEFSAWPLNPMNPKLPSAKTAPSPAPQSWPHCRASILSGETPHSEATLLASSCCTRHHPPPTLCSPIVSSPLPPSPPRPETPFPETPPP